MKRILLAIFLFSAISVSADESLFSSNGFTVLKNAYSVGGDVFCDFSTGGARGNWGIGTSKELLTYSWSVTKTAGIKTYTISLDFSYPIAFQTYTGKGLSLIYDLSPHISSLDFLKTITNDTFKTGVWFGVRTDMAITDPGAIIGGIRAQVIKFTL